MTSQHEFKKIKILFESEGKEIKQQLIISVLFLMVFEQFKKFVVSTVDAFCRECDNGNMLTKRGPEFKEIIKKFGKRKSEDQHNAAF
jgi:Zn-finger domain-containing protein